MKNRAHFTILIALLLVGLVPAMGAAYIEQRIQSDGFGPERFGATTGETTLFVDGQMGWRQTSTEFSGKFMKRLSGNRSDVGITRLDRDLVWQVNEGAGTYSEVSFDWLRQQRDQAMAQLEQMQGAGANGRGDAPPGESGYQFEPPEVEIRQTDQTETIAGFEARLTEVRVKSVGRHAETGQTCEVSWDLDQWIGPETEVSKQLAAFHKDYAEKLGISPAAMQGVGDGIAGMLGGYGEGMDRLVEHMVSVEGTPLRHTMRLHVGGGCNAGSGVAGEDSPESSMTGMKKSFAKFKGKFGKKKNKQEEPQPEASPAAMQTPAPDGMTQLFGVTVETTEIGERDPGSDRFAEPTHLKKVEPAGLPPMR